MKMQVQVKTLTKEVVTLNLVVSSTDTVRDVKDRVALVEPNPFPDQALYFEGKKLDDQLRLADCVRDGAVLNFDANASDDALAQQLQDLLQAKGGMDIEELGLLYSLNHGVTIGQALQALGKHELLRTFLERFGKRFEVGRDGSVKLAGEPVAPKNLAKGLELIPEDAAVQRFQLVVAVVMVLPFAISTLDPVTLEVDSVSTVAAVKDMVASAALIPFQTFSLILDGKALVDEDRLCDCGVTPTSALELKVQASEDSLAEQFASLLKAQAAASRVEFDNMFCLRFGAGAGAALQTLGWGEKLQHFLERHPRFDVSGAGVRLAAATAGKSPKAASGNQKHVDLHAQLAAASCAEATQSTDSRSRAAKELRFVDRQPAAVKATIRLLKWWRDQRQWSSDQTRPGDFLLEALVVHAVSQRVPRDLEEATAEVLSVMARFDELVVTWPLALRSFREADVDPQVLQQRPLVLDPTNPQRNLASAQAFEPRELIQHARAGFF